jgi:4'-phosphopantetheinyl transferase
VQAGERLEQGADVSLDENGPSDAATGETPNLAALSSPAAGVTLWWCVLHASATQLHACMCVLSAAEHARAARFGDARLRDRYVIGRAAVRSVLGRRLGVAPGAVPIVRGARGRPQLAGDIRLDFNVSHTGDVALLGVLSGARLGVDVERTDRNINVAGIARRFLTAAERASLSSLDADSARRTVLRLWTCKEAMSKATGDALSAPFASIDVDLRSEPVSKATGHALSAPFASLDVDLRSEPVLRDGPGVYRPAQWSLHAAAVPDDYVATIAVWRAA